jgi:hypothetical protein
MGLSRMTEDLVNYNLWKLSLWSLGLLFFPSFLLSNPSSPTQDAKQVCRIRPSSRRAREDLSIE